jgi:hypothetical protein
LLLWKSVPSVDDAPADLVIGQADFVSDIAVRKASEPGTARYPRGNPKLRLPEEGVSGHAGHAYARACVDQCQLAGSQ